MSEIYDLVIIGGGPAGLAAGIYGGRAKMNVLVIEKSTVGGRAYTTREIVNYPGYNNSTGPILTGSMKEHAEAFGVKFTREEVKSVDFTGDIKLIKTKKNEYQAKAVILATGTDSRKLGIPGEKELTGQGVAYCATCDAEFFKDQEVVVVGSGDQAIEEGMYIAKFASKITVIVLHDEGILDCNKQAAEKAFAHPKMNFVWNSVVSEIKGEDEVTGVVLKNMKTGELTDFPCQGIFFFVGMVPGTKFLGDAVELDKRGYVITNDSMETSVPGVYAAGDIREKYLRQVATAVGDGATAATAAERYIEEMEDFRKNVVESEKPVLMGFWCQDFNGSLDKMGAVDLANKNAGDKYKFIEVDYNRKRSMAKKFGIVIDPEKNAAVIELSRGQKVRELDLNGDLSAQM